MDRKDFFMYNYVSRSLLIRYYDHLEKKHSSKRQDVFSAIVSSYVAEFFEEDFRCYENV